MAVAFYVTFTCIVTSTSAFALFLLYTGYVFIQHLRYRHIPGPKRASFYLGNIPQLRSWRENGKPVCDLFYKWSLEHGSTFLFWIFHSPHLIVSEPELIKKGLVTLNLLKAKATYRCLSHPFGIRFVEEGIVTEKNHDEWKWKRGMLNPAFHRKYLVDLMEVFNSSCDIFLEKINLLSDGKTRVNMSQEFARVTLDVISKVGFSIENIDTVIDEHSRFPAAISKALKGIQMAFRSPFWKFQPSLYPFRKEMSDAVLFLRKFAAKVIQERSKARIQGEKTPKDILDHMLDEADKNPSRIGVEDMCDHFLTIFVAGHETTSNQLAFTLYEIIKNPLIEARIYEELCEVLGSKSYVDHVDLGKLKYLNRTLKESLRLHPPVAATARVFPGGEMLGDYYIPNDTIVNFNIYLTHRHPSFWNEPEVFNPDRFSVESQERISHSQYFPFSLGPRNCIGQTLAQFESKVLMARLLKEFKFELIPGQSAEVEEALTLRPRDGVVCLVKRRQ